MCLMLCLFIHFSYSYLGDKKTTITGFIARTNSWCHRNFHSLFSTTDLVTLIAKRCALSDLLKVEFYGIC